MSVKVRGTGAMRIQDREAALAQGPGGLSEVLTGRPWRNWLGEAGGNECLRSVEVVLGVVRGRKR